MHTKGAKEMSRARRFIAAWWGAAVVGIIDAFAIVRLGVILITARTSAGHAPWYDIATVGFVVAGLSLLSTWYAISSSPRVGPAGWCLLIGVPVLWFGFMGFSSVFAYGYDSEVDVFGILFGCYWLPAVYSFICFRHIRREEARKTVCDKARNLHWSVRMLAEEAVERQESAHTIRLIQEARQVLYRLTGLSPRDGDVPESIERIEERLAEARSQSHLQNRKD